ncbi:MAG TPA: ECF transporter S component [Bacillota bacterium]|nr:ECF transporter S component [Bacillota bacterium]
MRLDTRTLTRTAILLGVTMAIQMLRMPQPVTGPLINAMLVLTTLTVGMAAGIFIGLLTPWVAFTVGILPPVLGPAIPFIMGGNAALVLVMGAAIRLGHQLKFPQGERLAQIGGVIVGGFAKYLVISTAVRFLIQVPPPVAALLQLPQLFTAWTGGALAVAIIWAARVLRESSR